MTIREYIHQKLPFFHLTDAQFEGISAKFGLDVNNDYSIDNNNEVGVAIIGIIEEQVLAPKLKSVNEGGFPATWNYQDFGEMYIYLCKEYRITPNPSVKTFGHQRD